MYCYWCILISYTPRQRPGVCATSLWHTCIHTYSHTCIHTYWHVCDIQSHLTNRMCYWCIVSDVLLWMYCCYCSCILIDVLSLMYYHSCIIIDVLSSTFEGRMLDSEIRHIPGQNLRDEVAEQMEWYFIFFILWFFFKNHKNMKCLVLCTKYVQTFSTSGTNPPLV